MSEEYGSVFRVRVPADLLDRIDAGARALMLTRSSFARLVIGQALGYVEPMAGIGNTKSASQSGQGQGGSDDRQ